MKTFNKFTLVLLTFIFSLSIITFPVMAQEGVKVVLNGKELLFDVPPQLINDRTMVPMRVIFEALGADVEWDNDTQMILAFCGECESEGITHNIRMKIGDQYTYTYRAKVNPGELPPLGMARIELDVPPMIVNGRTLVPVRAVSEVFDAAVEWDGKTQTVMIRQETEVDINDPEIQELFNSTMTGASFMAYYNGYADVALLDSPDKIIGGRMCELFSVLSLKDVPEKKYTDSEANEIISKFLSKGEITEDMSQYGFDNLKAALDRGVKFGESASQERLVAVYKKK